MSNRAPSVDTLDRLVQRLRAARVPSRRRIVGVAGGPGSGKSTLVEALAETLTSQASHSVGWVAHVPMDGFHLADGQLERLGRLERKGAPDTFDTGGYAALLGRLRTERDRVVYAPTFERALEQPVAGSIAVGPACELVLTEGNYLLVDDGPWRDVRAQVDEVWFLEADPALRRARLVERHVRYGKSRAAAAAWVRDVDEPNARRVEETRRRADLVVAGSVLDGLAISVAR